MFDYEIEQLPPSRYGEAQNFYSRVGYHDPIAPESLVFAAISRPDLIGVVRLCVEEGDLLLRGMMIDQTWQRRGVGSKLVKALESAIGARDCYCLPHDWLEGFYGQIGFRKISSEEAPAHLQARYQRYRNGPYPHIIVMKRHHKF